MPNSLQIPPYRAALLTGADGAPVIRANGPDSELVMTERQWYMFWQNLAGQLNANTQALEGLENLVTFGNHADRPDAGPWPDGALYVEWDRGSVLYQNQGGIWVYIAGQMFGTLSPDQRPTDLGMPDAGFAFRTNVDPARAFAWSGTAWIETTPIRYGTHAERLAAPVAGLVSGMLWMETDRGSVIYQNQGGTWLYLAGTMWDTMSPDHRPTDLGVFDAGFDYRSTDPPAREFIWNQTAWVDVSAVPGAVGGAAGLTHPNVVTKVGSAGQITEGGITDESAANSDKLHIAAAGNMGLGTGPSIGYGVAGTIFAIENTASNSHVVLGQSATAHGNWAWVYSPTEASATMDIGTRTPNSFRLKSANTTRVTLDATGGMGFFGAAAAAKQTLNAYTPSIQNFNYTATPASLATAATLADLNTLRLAYENLRASYDDLRTKLRTSTLVG